MARYIDTDILAKIVFDKWQECDELKHIIPAIRNAVMCASTADVVEVVRCKNCIHHKEHPRPIQTHVWCECVGGLLPIDWFCADGERRDDAET